MHSFRVYWISLYMFRTVFPSIIGSSRLYTQHQVYVIQVSWLLASGHEMDLHFVSASKQSTNLNDIYLMLCVQSWTPDDGRKDRPKHVEWYSITLKIVDLVDFTIEIYHNARSHERHICDLSYHMKYYFPRPYIYHMSRFMKGIFFSWKYLRKSPCFSGPEGTGT